MMILNRVVRVQQPIGANGDVFWDLPAAVAYVANTELPCIVYVANPTDEDREYMLELVVARAGVTLAQYPVIVDGLTWFPVEADTMISIPGSMMVGYSDAVLTLALREKESDAVVDSVPTSLSSSALTNFPAIPGLPQLPVGGGIDFSSMMMSMIMLMMMGIVVSKISKEV